jgi:hypothetical protein
MSNATPILLAKEATRSGPRVSHRPGSICSEEFRTHSHRRALGASPKVVSNEGESALKHHLGMTCDPVAG